LCIVAARAELCPDLPLARIAADLAAQPSLDAFTDMADPAADLRAAFSWSYQQLDSVAARAFRLAGLHPGLDLEPHTVAALTGMSLALARRALGTLARVSLIQAERPERYTVNHLLRAYAVEQAAQRENEEGHATAIAIA
jgi:DNA-binding GntR family transcriptional regulator